MHNVSSCSCDLCKSCSLMFQEGGSKVKERVASMMEESEMMMMRRRWTYSQGGGGEEEEMYVR